MRNKLLSGFTLVELIIALGVFGVLMVAGADFLVSVVQNSNRATIESEVRQNASKIMQDLVTEGRKYSCIYSVSPAPTTALLRMSDNTISSLCAIGNRLEYYQDGNGTLTKVATNSAGSQTFFGTLNSRSAIVLNCQSPNSPCGSVNCTAGLVTSPSGLLPSNQALSLTLYVQQKFTLTRPDFCAATKASDTVVPRVY